MNNAQFTELVNMYFDREISTVEVDLLRAALRVSEQRRAEFEARYRLHQAMQIALEPEVRKVEKSRELLAESKLRASRTTVCVLSSGLAACLLLGVAFFRPAITESSVLASGEGISEVDHTDIKRYAAMRDAIKSRRGSLASQFRLMGLTPDMAPAVRELDRVDLEAMRHREAIRQLEIDRINQYKSYSTLSDPRLLETLDPVIESPKKRWPAGFHSSLVSF